LSKKKPKDTWKQQPTNAIAKYHNVSSSECLQCCPSTARDAGKNVDCHSTRENLFSSAEKKQNFPPHDKLRKKNTNLLSSQLT
jgi:hypothetical protein